MAKPNLRLTHQNLWGLDLQAMVLFLLYGQDIELLSKDMNFTVYRSSRATLNQKEKRKTFYIIFRSGVNDHLFPQKAP